MVKFLNKYVRIGHRWLALPFILLLILVISTRSLEIGVSFQRAQQILMMVMAVSGLYLFLLPWYTKWRRRR